MVASTFSKETAKLGQAFAAGGLMNSVFDRYIAEGLQACELIVRNLGTASEFVVVLPVQSHELIAEVA